MFKRISIRWRLTILSILMLTLCCVGLTFVLNVSAFQYIDASATIPATAITDYATIPKVDNGIMKALPLQDTMEAKRGFGLESLFYMLAFIIGGGALTYFFVERSLKPLHLLTEQVNNLTVSNLAQPLDVPCGNDEIAELTRSFQDMSDKLYDAFLMQRRFSASAAHELRTPLAVLQTKIDVFKKKNAGSIEEYEAMITVFEKQTHKLRGLIKNLLEMTNSEENSEQSLVDMKDIFEEIISELSEIAEDKHISIQLQCDECSMIGNVDLLYRAFYNVIENSIKYNKINGYVEINVKQEHDDIAIRICDSGIGISEDAKKHIFEPFYQVDKDSQKEGVGLGLSIVENIIKKHHGKIEVTNGKQEGTCFQIYFYSHEEDYFM